MNPKKNQKFRSHVFVKPKGNKIKIKTEQQIERQLGIKVERHEPSDNNVMNSTQISPPDSWAEEKKVLIQNIMALKSENQMLVQKSNDKDIQLNSANVLKQELENRLDEKKLEYAAKFNELKRDLDNAAKKETDHMKLNSDLKRENSLLMSQNKQLQNELSQTEKANSNSDEDYVYEVESLLDDKLVSEQHYLVRWKGFDSDNDSWERESNLSCTRILKKYKQLKKKH